MDRKSRMKERMENNTLYKDKLLSFEKRNHNNLNNVLPYFK